ncbi:MAG: DUF2231 domain-containing protein [Desulfobacterales bacterium]
MIEFIYQTLAKVGYSHPLHPAMTHIPMGMIIGGFLFAVGSVVMKKDDLAKAAHYCYTLAIIFVLPTMMLGYMDWQYKFEAEWNRLILTKIILALMLTAMLVITFIYGKNVKVDIKQKLILYVICFAISMGLGFIGGELQYG